AAKNGTALTTAPAINNAVASGNGKLKSTVITTNPKAAGGMASKATLRGRPRLGVPIRIANTMAGTYAGITVTIKLSSATSLPNPMAKAMRNAVVTKPRMGPTTGRDLRLLLRIFDCGGAFVSIV